jgi:hypothetical protein
MKLPREWETLNATERAEQVSELYFRGLTVPVIARQLGAKPSEITHHIEIIQMSAYKSDKMDKFFDNLQQRTMEHLAALDSQIAIAYQELDYARERVIQVNQFGAPIRELDSQTGVAGNEFMFGPRNAPAIPKLMKALEVLHKQKAEVLRIVGQKSDVTVKLQITHQVQTVILEFIQQLDPSVYADLYRQIQAIVPDQHALVQTIEATAKEVLNP